MKMNRVLCGVVAALLATGAMAVEKTPLPVEGGGRPQPTPAPKTDNQDACGAALCLAGAAMQGSSPTGCDGYIRKYFEQQVITSSGFNPSKTFKARQQFLNQCSSADQQTKNNDNNRYGRSQGL